VTGRAVNPGKVHRQAAKFKATFRIVG